MQHGCAGWPGSILVAKTNSLSVLAGLTRQYLFLQSCSDIPKGSCSVFHFKTEINCVTVFKIQMTLFITVEV